MDWRFYLGFSLNFPTNVDFQTRIWWIWPIYCPQEVLLKQLNQYFPPQPFFSFPASTTPWGYLGRRSPPQQHFSSSDSVLFNNKSFQTNLHFWISFICIYFLFFAKFFVSPPNTPANLPTPHHSKILKWKTPPITLLLVCQVNKHKRRDYLASWLD